MPESKHFDAPIIGSGQGAHQEVSMANSCISDMAEDA